MRLSKLFALFIFALVLASAVPVQAGMATGDPWASVYSNWLYRRAITISNPNSEDLTDFQVKITLDSTNFDFSKANEDGSDIRFADTQGNPLSYWIEKWDNSNEEAIIWVKVPSIPANGETTIYMYYGNPSAESESDGDAVFEFFDDFDGTELDTSKWTEQLINGDYSVANSILTINANAWTLLMTTKSDFNDAVIETKLKQTSGVGTSNYGGVGVTTSTGNTGTRLIFDSGANYGIYDYDADEWLVHSSHSTTTTEWHIATFKFTSSEIKAQYADESELTASEGRTNQRVDIGCLDSKWEFDWIYVRKYAEQEPTISVGSEEVNNPVTVTFDFKDDLGNTLNGVDVYIDGSFYGTLNSGDSVVVSAGTHTFLAQKQHYVDAQQTLDVQSDTTLTLTLDRQSYTVYFYAYDVNNQTINGFNVYADGALLGTFDSGDSATLKYGTHTFRFEKELYKSVTLQKLINANGIIVNFTNIMLDNINLVTLYFYDASNGTTLNQVNVTVDGENKGLFDSGGVLQLVEGNHTLIFSKECYENRTLGIDVLSDITISVYLAPNITTNETALTSLENPTAPEELQGYAPNITSLNEDISGLFTGPVGWALAVLFVLALAISSIKLHQKPAVTAAVVGTSVIYLGTWIKADWGILWVLMAMLLSASVLRIFGRYQK